MVNFTNTLNLSTHNGMDPYNFNFGYFNFFAFKCDRKTVKHLLLASSYLSVRLSIRSSAWNNSAPKRRIFMKFYTSIFRKSIKKIKISFKSDKNNRYFT
jgi:hypothetical protein